MENNTLDVDTGPMSAEKANSDTSTNGEDQSIFRTFKELNAIARLEPNDFAFVKRSTGEWQLAVVMEVSDTYVYRDKYIKFLLDGGGHTKRIPAQRWTDMIRLEIIVSRRIEPIETCKSRCQKTLKSLTFNINEQLTKGTLDDKVSLDVTRACGVKQEVAKHAIKQVDRCASTENNSHQRAFKSALTSINHGSRSARARMA